MFTVATSTGLRSALLKQRRPSNFRYTKFTPFALPHYQPKRPFVFSSRSAPDGFPVFSVFTALAVFGVVVTAYGLYDFYSSFSIWPKAIRSDLRTAIKAQHQGNFKLSEQYLRRYAIPFPLLPSFSDIAHATSAWETSLQTPKEELSPDPWLKISGIACKLGEVLESADKWDEAYEIYLECAKLLRTSADQNQLSIAERHRAIAIALHIAHLANQSHKSHDEGQWLLWSINQFQAIFKSSSSDPRPTDGLQFQKRHAEEEEESQLLLPSWAAKNEYESALEALGSFYAKQGETQSAMALYLNAISQILLPPNSPEQRDPRQRCKAAQVMTNIANLLIQDNPSPERLNQAKEWTIKGLEITEDARRRAKNEPECEHVLATSFYNLGVILEMQDQIDKAKEQFKRALEQSRAIKFSEGIDNAEDALARLKISMKKNNN